MTKITEAASETIDEINAESQRITINQLTEWLSTEEQLKNTDVYSVISQFLSFLAYYQTPVVHKGMCIIAGSPCDEHSRFNEIFLARMPLGKIYGMSGLTYKADFDEVRTEFYLATQEVILDIIQARGATDELTFITRKSQVVDLVSHYFATNGYHQNSRHSNPD